jgi:exosortase C (VPDSG-CTERM-specific)
MAICVLIAVFGVHLYRLGQFALKSDLYSYILLVPFVSIYLFATRAGAPGSPDGSRSVSRIFLFSSGVLVFGILWAAKFLDISVSPNDRLALTTSFFVLLLSAATALFFSRSEFKRAVFPLAFLLFMVPFPAALEHAIETFLQRGSAPPAYWFFQIAGTPVFRQDMVFQLPGMTLQIAPECSGIRSSIVLFMTSLVAGHLFLRSPWKRIILTAVVVPLALLRNGFRVFVIGELCVHVGPHMIDSPIHHYGGPIFFILSLVPFAILTFFLVRSDRTGKAFK